MRIRYKVYKDNKYIESGFYEDICKNYKLTLEELTTLATNHKLYNGYRFYKYAYRVKKDKIKYVYLEKPIWFKADKILPTENEEVLIRLKDKIRIAKLVCVKNASKLKWEYQTKRFSEYWELEQVEEWKAIE